MDSTDVLLHKLVNQILFVMRFSGVSPADNSVFSKILWFIYVISNSTWIILSIITTRRLETMELLGNNVIYILGMSQILSELLVIKANGKNFLKMMKTLLENFWKTEDYNPEKIELHRKFYRILTIASKIYGFYFVLVSITLDMDPVLRGRRVHPVELRYPDPDFLATSPIYEIIYILQSFTIFVAAVAGTILFDVLYFVMILSVWIQFDLLKYRLSLINEKMSKDEINKNLEMCVTHHNMLLGFLQEIQTVFTYSLLNKMFCDVFVMCFTNYLIMSGKVVFSIKYPFLITGALFQTLIYCLTGEIITNQCEDVGKVAYDINWEIMSNSTLVSGLRMIITRSQKIVKIKAGRMLELSLANFVSIVKAAFSYYVFLKESLMNE